MDDSWYGFIPREEALAATGGRNAHWLKQAGPGAHVKGVLAFTDWD
jgi:hypothetical protein